jgi:hypothetical protein
VVAAASYWSDRVNFFSGIVDEHFSRGGFWAKTVRSVARTTPTARCRLSQECPKMNPSHERVLRA